MDDSIPAIARGAPSALVASPPRQVGTGWSDAARHAAAVAEPLRLGGFEPVAAGSPAATGPVRPGQIGHDGRFEKFILALQALTFDAQAAEGATDRVERMRAAAEELFGIDGLPQPVRPEDPAAEAIGAGQAAPPEPGPDAAISEPTEPPDTSAASLPAGPDAAGRDVPAIQGGAPERSAPQA